MLVKRLLEHFDAYERLHVDVNDVRDQLVDMGVQDEIRFHFVKMDAGKLRGIVYRYTKHSGVYGESILCSEIAISNDMGNEDEAWKRLVAVKEMLHVADCVNISAESSEAINILFDAACQDTGGSQATRNFLFWLAGLPDPTGFKGDGGLELRRLDGRHKAAALDVLAWWAGPTKSDQPLYQILQNFRDRFSAGK